MPLRRFLAHALTASLLAFGFVTGTFAAGSSKTDKPTLVLTANPAVGFTPVRIVFIAELKGGSDQQLYCPGVEWDWGDDTKTATSEDCDPYEPGKTEVKRRWVIDHRFDTSGDWQVELRLTQKDKIVAQGVTTLKLRPGARDGGDGGR